MYRVCDGYLKGVTVNIMLVIKLLVIKLIYGLAHQLIKAVNIID